MRNRLRLQGIEALRGAHDGGSEAWRGSAEVPPPRVFCRKSVEVIENKGAGREKERKERSRVRKWKEVKEIEEVKEVEGEDPARFVRDNTRNDTPDLNFCQ
jgi:hypothetical protein